MDSQADEKHFRPPDFVDNKREFLEKSLTIR